jgi:stringent starvation protein B
MPAFRSRRPYLIKAIYEWATDNGYTPHLLVAADYEGVVVPREYVQEGRITLNVSPMAVQSLDIQSDPIWFSARFAGRAFDVQVPSSAVLAVFARENGEGIVFGEVEPPDPGDKKPQAADASPKPTRPGGRPNLRVVK